MSERSAFGALGARREEAPSHTRAFVIEALLLTAVLAFSLAVLMSAFSRASLLSAEATHLTRASAVAQSAAERFAADPATAAGTSEQDGFLVTCTTDASEQAGGTLWTAAISVAEEGQEPLVALSTSRFVRTATAAAETGGAS